MINIIFDLDNTLTHRKDTIKRYANIFCEDFCLHLQNGVSPELLGELIAQLDGNGYAGHSERSRGIQQLDIWNESIDLESLLAHWRNWIPQNPSPMPGLYQVLEYFNDCQYALGVITNGSVLAQSSKIEALNIGDYFDAVLISEACGVKKPDKLIFEMALSELGADAANTFYIGDHPVNDYSGAMQAGITPIWFSGFHAWPDDLDSPVNSVSELGQCMDLVSNLASQ